MFYLVVISLYIGFCVLVVKGAGKLGAKKWLKVLIVIGLVLLPFWDKLTSEIIVLFRYVQDRPLQEIKRTVDSPESVLWVDEVWPGFDEYSRSWMLKSYLDGKNLKLLGLTAAGTSKVYVYTAEDPIRYKEYRMDDPAFPKFKYTVRFIHIPLPAWQEKFIWCDEIRIRDNEKSQEIAISRRYLGRNSKIWPCSVCDGDFEGGALMGDERAYEFDDKVLFRYAGVRDGLEVIKDSFKRSYYTRTASDWKSEKGRE